MSRINVYFPTELLDEIYSIVMQEGYEAIKPLFNNYIKAKTEYLSVDQDAAVNLLRLANIEMQKALLKYPYTDDEDENYNPEHEAQFDDVMMGIYEKTYYYLRTEFPDLEV
ncbi:hypothetical protein J2X32_002968 [Rheinheimera pacifica]|uniref:hypothetical protein n=1 Tax=Rheinheimera pacifica TaxID=173990 RepID=UPI00285809C2|nr:hypothetical protein [Rheinheimera pacifica]MDR6984324.1 hypothetical protein [Rheinheimera pacifica]